MFTRETKKLSAVEVMAPVKMDETASRAIHAAHRRKWTSIAAIVSVFATGAGVYFYTNLSKNYRNKIIADFVVAEQQYQVEQEAFVKSIQEQKSAKFDYTSKPDHSGSAKLFQEFSAKNSTDPLGWVAALRSASAQTDAGKYDAAAATLESILPKTMKHNLLQIRVRRSLAGIYSEKGDYQKALQQIDILLKMPDNPILAENKLFAAKVNYLSGDKKKAGDLLHEIVANPSFSLAGDRNSAADEAALWLGYWGL